MTHFSLRCAFSAAIVAAAVGFGVHCETSAHPSIELQVRQLDREISLAPGRAELLLRRAELFRMHGQFNEALNDIDAADHLSFNGADVARYRASLFLDMKRYDDALNAISSHMAFGPASSDAYLLLSMIQRAMGELGKSIASYERAVQLSTRPNPDHYIELSKMQLSAGQAAASLRTIDRGISRLGPIVSLQLAALGIEIEARQFDAALNRVDSLRSAGVAEESLLVWRARVLLMAGRGQEAGRICEQARKSILGQAHVRGVTPANQMLLAEIDGLLAAERQSVRAGSRP